MILFFDCETTGKADFKSPCDDPSQPRLVQLGAILTEDDGKEISSINIIVRPKGFDIPDAAASIHGITTTLANKVGAPIVRVLHVFHQLASAANCFVAHNIDFDELADMIIVADLIAEQTGIDLGLAIANKFNQTSHNVGINVFI